MGEKGFRNRKYSIRRYRFIAILSPMPTGFDDHEVQSILPELTWPQ